MPATQHSFVDFSILNVVLVYITELNECFDYRIKKTFSEWLTNNKSLQTAFLPKLAGEGGTVAIFNLLKKCISN